MPTAVVNSPKLTPPSVIHISRSCHFVVPRLSHHCNVPHVTKSSTQALQNKPSAHKKVSGCHKKYSVGDIKCRVQAVPFSLQQTIRSLTSKLEIPRSTLWVLMKCQVLTKLRSTVKTILTDANKARHVRYFKSFVDKQGYFKSMLNCIDIDEKLWYITKVT